MKLLIYKVFGVFEKASYLAYMRRIYPNLMNHTSHLKISAKNVLKLDIIFRGSLNYPLLSFFSLIFSLYLLYSLLCLHICRDIKGILQIWISFGFYLNLLRRESPYLIASFKLTAKHDRSSDNFFMIYLQ